LLGAAVSDFDERFRFGDADTDRNAIWELVLCKVNLAGISKPHPIRNRRKFVTFRINTRKGGIYQPLLRRKNLKKLCGKTTEQPAMRAERTEH
jgi:hypothetical protein